MKFRMKNKLTLKKNLVNNRMSKYKKTNNMHSISEQIYKNASLKFGK